LLDILGSRFENLELSLCNLTSELSLLTSLNGGAKVGFVGSVIRFEIALSDGPGEGPTNLFGLSARATGFMQNTIAQANMRDTNFNFIFTFILFIFLAP